MADENLTTVPTASTGETLRAESLPEILTWWAGRHPERVALRFVSDDGRTETSLTYAALRKQSQVIAATLCRHTEPGSRVLLVCPPGLDFVAAFFGCLSAGLVAVPTSAPHPRRLDRDWPRLSAVLGDCGASVIVTSPELRPPLQDCLDQENGLQSPTILSFAEFGDAVLQASTDHLPTLQRDQLAFLQYTSGSTRTPQGVMISHGNLLANLTLIQTVFGLNEAIRGVFWLPFHHDMGLIGGILGTLFCGGTSTFFSPLAFVHRPLRWLQLISEQRANISGGPNFAYDECTRRISDTARTGLDLRSWKVAFCGAEPIHAETLHRFADAFADCGFVRTAFLPCYGLAEATLLVTGRPAGRPLTLQQRRPGEPVRVGCGAPQASQRVVIVSPESQACCVNGEVGEIWISGNSVGQGYWGQPEESDHLFRARTADGDGPFLRTGDLGYFHNGELFITGRLKDLIIINGRNLYPQDLERTVHGCHAVLKENACVAFSIESNQQEQLVIIVEVEPRTWARSAANHPQAAAGLTDETIRAITQAITDQHEVTPRVVRLVSAYAIPRTTSGKLRRRACREAFLADQLDAVK